MWLESRNGYLLPLVLHERRGPVVGPVVPPHVVDQLELEEARELQGEGADQGDQDELVVRLPGDQRVANGLKNKMKHIHHVVKHPRSPMVIVVGIDWLLK